MDMDTNEDNEKSACASTSTDADGPESKTRRMEEGGSSSASVEKSENDDQEEKASDLFPKLRSQSKNRNYRKTPREAAESSSEEEQGAPAEPPAAVADAVPSDDSWEDVESRSSRASSTLSSSSSERRRSDTENEADDMPLPQVLSKQKPKHKWSMIHEVRQREQGISSHKNGAQLMHARFYGSLHAVQRLELMYKLENHEGCVNALNFNRSGTKLASGSDDLNVVVWDWARGEKYLEFESGHRSNLFQAKFIPMTDDTQIVTCGRDGQVRLAVLSVTGKCTATRRLAQHAKSAHKLAVQQETPQVVLSAGEDGQVLCIDLREPKPTKLVTVKEANKKIALYSINSNPFDNNEFVVGGRDSFVRLYDKRKISENTVFKKFCPQHLQQDEHTMPHITCVMFNHDGTEVLASYNDDDIYLFDTRHSEEADYVHKYQGHRNSATVKGVGFFGPKSEYVVSGSDCGHVFFWDKNTESIVQFMSGDEAGVVNCLEPHPHIPVIATSGLDHDVKIWIPSNEQEPELAGLRNTVISNLKRRSNDAEGTGDAFDAQMLWFLWRQLRGTEGVQEYFARRNRQENRDSSSSDDNVAVDDLSGDEDPPEASSTQCAPS